MSFEVVNMDGLIDQMKFAPIKINFPSNGV